MIKAVMENWSLHQVKGRVNDAPGVVGRVACFGNGGQTTEIVAFDAINKTVTTRSGSVYGLGVPNLGFAIANRSVMSELGF